MEQPVYKRRAAPCEEDVNQRAPSMCSVCGTMAQRMVDPAERVPELAHHTENFSFCSWTCAYQSCASLVSHSKQQMEMVSARFESVLPK